MAGDRLDFVIYGATGFTGKYTVKEAARLTKLKGLKWGVAGRRREALEAVVKEFAPDSENLPIILADIADEESLKKMTERAKVLVNCCGPYGILGEPVIKACIATKTHHVDVSGEPLFMERIQLEYDKAAREAGVYVISACGFDSIPCDLGIIFTQQKFEGEVNSVETYLNTWMTTKLVGAALHYGTWHSVVVGLADKSQLRGIRSKLYPEPMPELAPKLKARGFHRSAISEGYSLPFPGSDRPVALRTQRFIYEIYKQRPAQVQSYFTLKSLMAVFLTIIFGGMLSLLTKFNFGRKLLLKYPKFFSAGYASHEGPTEETMENLHFSITFKASGWTEKLKEPVDKHVEPPNKELIAKVSGVNPGYGSTCTALLLSATTILKEVDKMPQNGGVLPPGAAFAKTSMIEELNKNGFKFEVISSIEK